MKKLHPLQEKLLELSKKGEHISRRELAKMLGVASMSTVCHHIEQLTRKGYKLQFEEKQYGKNKYVNRVELKRELNDLIAANKAEKEQDIGEAGIAYANGIIDSCEYLLSLFG